jgi:hypothetical protein
MISEFVQVCWGVECATNLPTNISFQVLKHPSIKIQEVVIFYSQTSKTLGSCLQLFSADDPR